MKSKISDTISLRNKHHECCLKYLIKSFCLLKLSYEETLRIEGSFRVFTDKKLAISIQLDNEFRKGKKSRKKNSTECHREKIRQFLAQKQIADSSTPTTGPDTPCINFKIEPQIKIEIDETVGENLDESLRSEQHYSFFNANCRQEDLLSPNCQSIDSTNNAPGLDHADRQKPFLRSRKSRERAGNRKHTFFC